MAPATSWSSLDDLSADVVSEILLRLPSASVFRCRAVCRAWRGITSSPGFAAAYSRRRPPELVVQRHGANGVLDTIPLTTLEDEASRRCLHPGYPAASNNNNSKNHEYKLMASCGDLLLFRRDKHGGMSDLWLCNPVSRQWSAVAPPHRNGRLTMLCGLYLHRPSGEHRLLFLANDTWSDLNGPASHYVGSLELDAAQTYRRLGPALASVYILFSQAILADRCLDYHGKLHWLHHPEVTESDKILAFDTVSETFRRTMSRPPPLLRSTKQQYYGEAPFLSLLEMDGRLAMAATPDDAGTSMRMDLWVLEDYDSDDGESWTCRHRIDLSALSSLPSSMHRHNPCCWAMDASALLGHSNNDHDVILLGDTMSLSVVLYHLTEKRVLKRIQVVDANDNFERRTFMSALVFRESLETHGSFHLHKP